MDSVYLEVVSRVLTTFNHCSHCEILYDKAGLDNKFHQRDLEEYPADLQEEFFKLSDWIRELSHRYKNRLFIRLIDAQSPLGVYKAIRHRFRKYPTFIIEGKKICSGWDKKPLEDILDTYISPIQT